MALLMFQQLMKIQTPIFFIRICIRICLSLTLQCNVNDKKNLMEDTKFSFYMLLHLLGAICLEKWISDPLIQVIQEIDTKINELW